MRGGEILRKVISIKKEIRRKKSLSANNMAKAHQVRGSFPLYADLDDGPVVHRTNGAPHQGHAAATATQQKITA